MIRPMRSEIKGFGTFVREILSEICEDPTHARVSVINAVKLLSGIKFLVPDESNLSGVFG